MSPSVKAPEVSQLQSHIRTGRVAVVHPPHKVSAEISRDYLQRWLRGKGKSEELITKLNSLLDRSQIKTRYILLSPDEVLEPRLPHNEPAVHKGVDRIGYPSRPRSPRCE